VLRSPDFFRPFFVQCDASKSGVGGVLDQKTDEGDEFPIAFVSKKLSKARKNYSVTVQECLAAIVCIKRFCSILYTREWRAVSVDLPLRYACCASESRLWSMVSLMWVSI